MTAYPMINGVDHVRLTYDEFWALPPHIMGLVETLGTPLRVVGPDLVGFEIDRARWASILRQLSRSGGMTSTARQTVDGFGPFWLSCGTRFAREFFFDASPHLWARIRARRAANPRREVRHDDTHK